MGKVKEHREDVAELHYERRLAILLRRSADRAEDVFAFASASLFRRAARGDRPDV